MYLWLMLIGCCINTSILSSDKTDQKRVAWIANSLGLEPTSPIARTLQDSRNLQNSQNPPAVIVTSCLQSLTEQQSTLAHNHTAQPCINYHIDALQQLSTPKSSTAKKFNICRFLSGLFANQLKSKMP